MVLLDDFLNIMKLPDGTPLVSVDMVDWLLGNGFFNAPASTKYHGNYDGGLFDHSCAVMKSLVDLTEKNSLKWNNPRSPYIVGMFHDLCKIDQYRGTRCKDGVVYDHIVAWDYNTEILLKGHGDKSVMLLSQFYALTEEEILCIRYHMGAFTEKEEWRDYTRAIHIYPNVLWTHHADMIASHIHGV